MNSIDLKGRRAIVTGGAQGLGRAIAERLQISGADVAIWDFDRAAMREAQTDWCGGGPAWLVSRSTSRTRERLKRLYVRHAEMRTLSTYW